MILLGLISILLILSGKHGREQRTSNPGESLKKIPYLSDEKRAINTNHFAGFMYSIIHLNRG